MNRLFSKISDMHEGIVLICGLGIYCLLVFFLGIPCPIYLLTGISCPGCGMTRALFSLLRLDFYAAFYYHPLIFVCILALPALLFVHIKNKRLAKKILVAVLVIIFIATYLYRLIILKSPVLHFTPEDGIFVKLLTKIFS